MRWVAEVEVGIGCDDGGRGRAAGRRREADGVAACAEIADAVLVEQMAASRLRRQGLKGRDCTVSMISAQHFPRRLSQRGRDSPITFFRQVHAIPT